MHLLCHIKSKTYLHSSTTCVHNLIDPRGLATSKCKVIQDSRSYKNLIIFDNLPKDMCYLINNKVRFFIGQPQSNQYRGLSVLRQLLCKFLNRSGFS